VQSPSQRIGYVMTCIPLLWHRTESTGFTDRAYSAAAALTSTSKKSLYNHSLNQCVKLGVVAFYDYKLARLEVLLSSSLSLTYARLKQVPLTPLTKE